MVRRSIVVLLVASVLFLLLASPLMAEKPAATIPPGTWHGSAYWTGAISSSDVSATLATPAIYSFEFQIEPDGTVSNGFWNLSPTNVNVNVPSLGQAGGTIMGNGSVSGTGDYVVLSGNFLISVSVPSLGVSNVPVEFPASGGFQATTATCDTIYGDLAREARQAQQAAGFATSVLGPFTAVKVAGPGSQGVQSWEQNWIALIDKMEAMTLNPNPTAKEVFQLVTEIENFQANIVQAQSCPDLPKSFQKGKQPYTYFVEKYTEMLNELLANPAAYSGTDIAEMLFAALQLGAVGSAAPDQQAAQELEAKFKDVLGQKLDADIAAGDKNDAKLIYLAASQAGYKDLAAKAHDFAFS